MRGAEEAVTLLAGARHAAPADRRAKRGSSPALEELAGALSDAFDTRVRLELGRSKGRIVVEFATEEDLQRIVTIMAPRCGRGDRSRRPIRPADELDCLGRRRARVRMSR